MPLISIGDTSLHVEMAGEGPAVLLVAGLGGRGAFWRAQAEALAPHFRVILHDHRGVGASLRGPTARTTSAMADDVEHLMDALEIDRAMLVGHSTGGAIGQHLALRHPERIARLVLSSSWAGPSPLFLATFALRKQVLEQLGPDAYLMLGTLLGTPAWWLHDRFLGAADYLAERRGGLPDIADELARLDAVMTHDLRAQLPRILVPTLAICAQDDQLTPVGFTEEIAAAIPGAECEILPKGGHFCPQTMSEDYNRRILRFLKAGQAHE